MSGNSPSLESLDRGVGQSSQTSDSVLKTQSENPNIRKMDIANSVLTYDNEEDDVGNELLQQQQQSLDTNNNTPITPSLFSLIKDWLKKRSILFWCVVIASIILLIYYFTDGFGYGLDFKKTKLDDSKKLN
jgi:hypothetical protein